MVHPHHPQPRHLQTDPRCTDKWHKYVMDRTILASFIPHLDHRQVYKKKSIQDTWIDGTEMTVARATHFLLPCAC